MSIITDMPMAEYQARPEVSKHDLDDFEKAPSVYRYFKDNPKAEREEMGIGSLAHLILLEPEKLDELCIVLPPDPPRRPTAKQLAVAVEKRSDAAKKSIEFWEEWTAKADGKTIVKSKDLETVRAMHASVMGNRSTRKLLESAGLREASLFWSMGGVECRMRPDILADEGIIIDPKTTSDARRNQFMAEIYRMRYHNQSSYYKEGSIANGYPFKAFIFLPIETKPPYLCTYYKASDVMLDWGKIENDRSILNLKKCQETGEWPGLIGDLNNPIELPAWAI